MRKVKLVNLHTGKLIKESSIINFCNLVGLAENEQCHLTPVLDQLRWSFKDWVLPETYEAMHQKWDWVDFYGNYFNLSIYEILNKFGLKQMFPPKVSQILMLQSNFLYGLHFKEASQKFLTIDKRKILRISVHKDGKILSAKTEKELSQMIDVERSGLNKLIHGKLEYIKGWRLKEVKVGNKTAFDHNIVQNKS